MIPSAPAPAARLTPDQTRQFHRDGYLAPLTACTPDDMARYRDHIERVLPKGMHNRHLDDGTIIELSTLDRLVHPMQSILGENLLLWRTHFFSKMPGGKEIPWHQDRNYWPIEPEIVITAWIAIDQVTVENSCLQLIPGSHRLLVQHVPSTSAMEFDMMADPARVDLTKKVDIELSPGQFVLFNERTLHHSELNRSQKRRIGLSIRMITPQVRILQPDSPSHKPILVSGQDTLGFNAAISLSQLRSTL